jgi:hypothetical protein
MRCSTTCEQRRSTSPTFAHRSRAGTVSSHSPSSYLPDWTVERGHTLADDVEVAIAKNLTVRNLDDQVKERLRIRAADTNVVSELMKPSPSEAVIDWVRARTGSELFTTSITLAEILYGIARLPDGRRKELLRTTASDVFAAFGEAQMESLWKFNARYDPRWRPAIYRAGLGGVHAHPAPGDGRSGRRQQDPRRQQIPRQ